MKKIKVLIGTMIMGVIAIQSACKKTEGDDMSMLALMLSSANSSGSNIPITMINLGDSLTNGDQSGATHEFSQEASFPQLIANQMFERGSLPWDNPLLNATGGSAGQRKEATTIPYNLGINGHTTK